MSAFFWLLVYRYFFMVLDDTPETATACDCALHCPALAAPAPPEACPWLPKNELRPRCPLPGTEQGTHDPLRSPPSASPDAYDPQVRQPGDIESNGEVTLAKERHMAAGGP